MPRHHSRTETQLLDFVDAYLTAHDEWVAQANRKDPDEPYLDALEDLLNAFAADVDIPADCRDLAVAVETLDAEYESFNNRANQGNHYPRDSFWLAVDLLQKARRGTEEEPLPPLPTIAQLRKENVPDWQIAKLLGMVPVHDLAWPERYAHLVQREIDQPGSIMDPSKGWCDPRLRDRIEQVRAVESRHEALLAKKHDANHEAESWTSPFTIEELIQQSVSDEQIARMHRVEIEYVAAIRAEIERGEADSSKEKQAASQPTGKRSRTPAASTVNPSKPSPTPAKVESQAAAELTPA